MKTQKSVTSVLKIGPDPTTPMYHHYSTTNKKWFNLTLMENTSEEELIGKI
jgi:hypothetical protein